MIEHMYDNKADHHQVQLPPEVDAWLHAYADAHHGGDLGQAVIALLTAASWAERSWADLHDEVFTRPRHVPPQL